jgi:hypothetical protein
MPSSIERLRSSITSADGNTPCTISSRRPGHRTKGRTDIEYPSSPTHRSTKHLCGRPQLPPCHRRSIDGTNVDQLGFVGGTMYAIRSTSVSDNEAHLLRLQSPRLRREQPRRPGSRMSAAISVGRGRTRPLAVHTSSERSSWAVVGCSPAPDHDRSASSIDCDLTVVAHSPMKTLNFFDLSTMTTGILVSLSTIYRLIASPPLIRNQRRCNRLHHRRVAIGDQHDCRLRLK